MKVFIKLKISKLLLRLVYINGILIFIITLYFALISPSGLNHILSLKFVDSLPESTHKSTFPFTDIIEQIPYQSPNETVLNVFPEENFQKTMIEGNGNCSNLVDGFAYSVSKMTDNFRIIDFLPNTDFLYGLGHTVVELADPKDNSSVLLDILEGGVIMDEEIPAQIEKMPYSDLDKIWIKSLNQRQDSIQTTFEKGFFEKTTIAITKGEEVVRYFKSLNKIPLRIGNKFVEKILVQGISHIFGIYPKKYVLKRDKRNLFGSHIILLTVGKTYFILIWLELIILGLLAINKIYMSTKINYIK